MENTGHVRSVNVSERKGTRKKPVEGGQIHIDPHHGVTGDAHAGDWHRQVSLLAWESIEKARAMGLDVKEGDFAENITTEGMDLARVAARHSGEDRRRGHPRAFPDWQGVSQEVRHLLPGGRLHLPARGHLLRGYHRRHGVCGRLHRRHQDGRRPLRYTPQEALDEIAKVRAERRRRRLRRRKRPLLPTRSGFTTLATGQDHHRVSRYPGCALFVA